MSDLYSVLGTVFLFIAIFVIFVIAFLSLLLSWAVLEKLRGRIGFTSGKAGGVAFLIAFATALVVASIPFSLLFSIPLIQAVLQLFFFMLLYPLSIVFMFAILLLGAGVLIVIEKLQIAAGLKCAHQYEEVDSYHHVCKKCGDEYYEWWG